ncbi:MAG TPA: 3D domain-containing protein, partial [Labilithrix sp.]
MRRGIVCAALIASACGGSGKEWVKEPMAQDERVPFASGDPAPRNVRNPTRTIGGAPRVGEAGEGGDPAARPDPTGGGGRVLGTFRNTYYDFPREADHAGDEAGGKIALMNASCQPIAQVPRSFHDAVCVQGSGSLKRGGTVSFAKRDCACAEVCPKTGQRICFDALDPQTFPYGRGATGRPITPLRTVAADTSVLPMGSVLYIPELDGDGLDGCFVVEDRGSRVKGEHVDIFTGSRESTKALEARVPSN